MKQLITIISLVLTMVLLSVVKSDSSSFTPDFLVDLKVEPVSIPKTAGLIELSLTVIANTDCDEVQVYLRFVDNLKYMGDSTWTMSMNKGDSVSLFVELDIPANDTSGIGLSCGCGKRAFWWEAYFTEGPEGVNFHKYNPRGARNAPKTMIDQSDPPMEELWKRSARNSPGGYMLFTKDESGKFLPSVGDPRSAENVWGLTPEGEFVPFDSLLKIVPPTPAVSAAPVMKSGDRSKIWMRGPDGKHIKVDTVWLFDSLKQAKTQEQLEEMRQLEQTALTEFDKQGIKVDGKTYVRSRGEYKFHSVETTTDPIGYSEKYRDSINIAKGKVFEFNFDLRNPSHLEYAKSKIDNLAPTDSAGFYRATIEWQTVLELKEKGIVFHKIGWKPREERDESGQNEKIQKKKY